MQKQLNYSYLKSPTKIQIFNAIMIGDGPLTLSVTTAFQLSRLSSKQSIAVLA